MANQVLVNTINTTENGIEPTFFDTITQYDNKFDPLWLANPDVKKGLACPYFSLFISEKFMNKNSTDKEDYEKDLELAINTNILMGTNDEMTFEQLVGYTDLNKKDIGCTVAELISNGDFKLEKELFESTSNEFCVIFLKNAKFFVVLCDASGFHVRDSHESVQFTFYSTAQLIYHLNTVYQFSETVNVGGITYGDYSSIEFIKIEKQFQNVLQNLVESKLEDQEEVEDDLKQMKGEDNDDSLQAAIAASLNKSSGFVGFDDFDISKVGIDCDSDNDDLISDDED